MKCNKKIKDAFHTIESFKKHGFKQVSTWMGVIIFICVFNNDLLMLVHRILISENLAEKLATGLAGFVLVWFNKLGKK